MSVEGPAYDAHSYAVFFENPSGKRLEICYRESIEVPEPISIVRHSGYPGPFQHEGLSTVSEDATKQVHELVNAFDRSKARQIFATLIRLPGDFDAAKATLHEAFARGDRSLGTSWRVGQLAIRAFTNAGLCEERSPGGPLGDRFFQFPPMVRRVPGYRQNTIVSHLAQL